MTDERTDQPRLKIHVRPVWFLFVALVPLIVLGILALSARVYSLIRYDPVYFTGEYLEKYGTPGDVARALEGALQTADQALLAELQGLRWPADFKTAPSIVFVMLWERTERYSTYLYFDMDTYERQPHYFEEVGGRWVVAPADLVYYLESGRWRQTFMPIAVVWWLVGGLVLVLLWLSRASQSFRARLYGD
jgi:hypothetical protein